MKKFRILVVGLLISMLILGACTPTEEPTEEPVVEETEEPVVEETEEPVVEEPVEVNEEAKG